MHGVPADRNSPPDLKGAGPPDASVRIARGIEYQATVADAFRAHAIDRGYERVREIERGTVTPAMRRIESEDPTRHLAGFENRLKGKDRLAEKVTQWMDAQPGLRADDAIR